MIDSIGRRLAGERAVVSANSAGFLWIVVCTLDSACCQLSMGRYISLLVLSLILATTAVPADAQGRGRGVSRFGAPTPPVPGSAAADAHSDGDGATGMEPRAQKIVNEERVLLERRGARVDSLQRRTKPRRPIKHPKSAI